MAHTHQLAVVRTWACLLHLGGEEIGETLAIKTIDVIDWIALSRQGVHEHSGTRRHRSLSNLEINNVSLADETMGTLLRDLPNLTHVFNTHAFSQKMVVSQEIFYTFSEMKLRNLRIKSKKLFLQIR